ncbi:DUF6541 family protein [Enorma phocaeensis]|uniref:DUF6541 family protein n=1 Tax=Enorma phocaeensis TaxID=1871019 RepID=UPI002353E622|nr:DUF6541 family protein [Enorma phocaeensis]
MLLAILLICALLLVPGFALLRILRLPPRWSLCLSPLPSISLIALTGQLFAFVGIPGNLLTVGLATAALLAVLWLLVRSREVHHALPAIPPLAIALTLILGAGLGYNLFLSRLAEPDALFQAYDVTQHLNLIRSMADSGRLSSIAVTPYATAADRAIDPFGGAGFYPAAWHALCAIVVQTTGFATTVVINASTFVFSCLVFPLGLIALFALLFGGDRKVVLCGSLTTLAFVAFPWALITFGPVFPNLAGFTVVPVALVLFVYLCGPSRNLAASSTKAAAGGTAAHRNGLLTATPLPSRICCGAILLLCVLGLALLHPNTVFTCAVVLIPYCISRIAEELRCRGIDTARKILACVGFAVVCLGIWYVCYKLPFLQETVTHIWPDFLRLWQAIVQVLSLSYTTGFFSEMATQFVLAALVMIGAVRALNNPRLRWVAFSYAFACFIFIVSATQSTEIKQFLAGFWYTDPMRLAAMAAIAASPLAALGLAWAYDMALALVTGYNERIESTTHPIRIAVLLGVGFLLLNFAPEFNLPGLHSTPSESVAQEYEDLEYRDWPKNVHTTFGDYRAIVSETYSYISPLSLEEQRFLERIATYVPTSELVLNDPMDGSFLAYGMYGIRTYYRNFIGYGTPEETEASRVIRLHLYDYAQDPAVQEAVAEVDARYVLVMDQDDSEYSFIDLRGDYKPQQFAGIAAIDSTTPGFTLVDHFGRIALYRIDR